MRANGVLRRAIALGAGAATISLASARPADAASIVGTEVELTRSYDSSVGVNGSYGYFSTTTSDAVVVTPGMEFSDTIFGFEYNGDKVANANNPGLSWQVDLSQGASELEAVVAVTLQGRYNVPAPEQTYWGVSQPGFVLALNLGAWVGTGSIFSVARTTGALVTGTFNLDRFDDDSLALVGRSNTSGSFGPGAGQSVTISFLVTRVVGVDGGGGDDGDDGGAPEPSSLTLLGLAAIAAAARRWATW